MDVFITFQFSYFPLVWKPKVRINKIHEKAARLVYKDETNLFFDHLLKKDL